MPLIWQVVDRDGAVITFRAERRDAVTIADDAGGEVRPLHYRATRSGIASLLDTFAGGAGGMKAERLGASMFLRAAGVVTSETTPSLPRRSER